jgi:hypothetical protein
MRVLFYYRGVESLGVGYLMSMLKENGHEIDLQGKFVLPGFVDMHGHLGGTEQGTPAEYVLKLWMAHGITTIRDPGSGNGLDFMLDHKARSSRNEITAPRIQAYVRFGADRDEPFTTPEQAREWVRDLVDRAKAEEDFRNSPARYRAHY